MNLLRIVLLVLWPLSLGAEEPTLPNPPVGHVLDRSEWLSRPQTEQLDTELARLRREHKVDVIVVVWDRSLPVDDDLDAFARHLGEQWAREDLWALILQMPESVNRPAVAYDGNVIAALRPEPVANAIRQAVNRGMKDWSEPARLRSVGLEVAEELVYLRLRRQFEQNTIKEARAEEIAAEKRKKETLMIRITVAVMAAILVLGTIIAIRVFMGRRGPARMTFPATRWRRRLQAPWCGGSDLVTTFTPPEPK